MPYLPPSLDIDTLIRLRVPPERDETRVMSDDDNDSDHDPKYGGGLPGAFPSASMNDSVYY